MVRIVVATALVGAGLLTLTVIGFVPGMAPVFGSGAVLASLMLTWSAPVSPRPSPFEAVASPDGPAALRAKSP
jgi:hypothetical protein